VRTSDGGARLLDQIMKLALGTVQFGLDYGVTNQSGKVEESEIEDILDFAKSNGINILDTASGYGNSEQVLGGVGVDDYQIITKTTSLKHGVDEVIKGFYQSLKYLNQKSIDGLLIHDINEVNDKEFDDLFERLNELKQQGLVNKIGFSIYTPEQVNFLLENFDFDIIQLPFNVFDTRLVEGGQLQELKKKNIEIHARSVFLQGVLLDFDNLSSYFSTWRGRFDKYQEVVEKSGMSLLEYALNFALNTKGIDKVLVGVNSEQQLREIIQSAKKEGKSSAHPINDVNLLNPSLWRV
jgi:aryl-alcohol dehydrogenase-like predicted oxidoreductase